MTTAAVEHTSFVVERALRASPGHAFRFWSEPERKARWSGCHPDWTVLEERFDFRVGGAEVKRWRTPAGDEQTFHAHYLDIVPGQRLIYAYEMSFKGQRLSASLVTVEFRATGSGTTMRFTEQAAFLVAGSPRQERIIGTGHGLDRLADILAREGALKH